MTTVAPTHRGTVRQEFSLAIRGQLVSYRAGAEILADDATRKAIDDSGDAADVLWEGGEEAALLGPADDGEGDTADREEGEPLALHANESDGTPEGDLDQGDGFPSDAEIDAMFTPAALDTAAGLAPPRRRGRPRKDAVNG